LIAYLTDGSAFLAAVNAMLTKFYMHNQIHFLQSRKRKTCLSEKVVKGIGLQTTVLVEDFTANDGQLIEEKNCKIHGLDNIPLNRYIQTVKIGL
jgi:hypothetical protein